MEKERQGLAKGKVICHRCRKEMPYKNNTANLYAHLERHYKEEYVELRASILAANDKDPKTPIKQSTMPERLRKLQPLDKSTTRYKKLVAAMVQFNSQDMQPISVSACDRKEANSSNAATCAHTIVFLLERTLTL